MHAQHRSMRCVLRPVATAAAALGMGSLAHAQVVLLDMGSDESFRGASVSSPDVNGNHWNSVWSGAFYPNIVDTDGTATEIDFGFTTATGTDYFNGPSGATQDPSVTVYNAAALGRLGLDEAVYDFYVTSTFQIQGLDPTKTYNLTFFGSHKFNNDNMTRYTVYTDDTFSVPVASADLLVGVGPDHNQDTVVTIAGVSPQANNILYVGFRGASGGDGYLNAMQIEVVPAPPAVALLALAGLCPRRRRPRRAAV